MLYKTDYDAAIQALVKEQGCPLDWRLIKAQSIRESGLDPNIPSPAGAVGLMQLMPDTAAEYGCTDRTDPIQNLRAGIKYMTHLYSQFKSESTAERIKFAWGAYNAGEGNILQAQAECHKVDLRPDIWNSIAIVLFRITGDNAKQTVEYVKAIQNILLELLITEGADHA